MPTGILENQIIQTLRPGMHMPEELSLLFTWIETNGFYKDSGAKRLGFLYDLNKASWTKTERDGGTHVYFAGDSESNSDYWLTADHPDIKERLCFFAGTGGDGSLAAFWLTPEGEQKIVHLGSASGSSLLCVLADNAIDFLRLLAIGYDEICWNQMFELPPNEYRPELHCFIHPNRPYQEWVKKTFGVEIPQTASEIVKHPAQYEDQGSADPFNRWLEHIPIE